MIREGRMTNRILQHIVFISLWLYACAFAPSATISHHRKRDALKMSTSQDKTLQPFQVYPALSRIAGINWTGDCRYVGPDLVHLSKLKLTGGVRYEINGTDVTLSSFLTFPNGNTREVMMTGNRDSENSSPVIHLRSVEEGGPITMQVTEIGTDTILINEVEVATGKTILTASLSIIEGSKGMEIVQVSHEVGDGKQAIEGHQVWRLTGKGPVEFNDFDFRDGTGW